MARRPATRPSGLPMPVAAYMRMSTDMQQYSIHNQSTAIDSFAEQHGMDIVRVYRDEGRSGLTIEHRPGLTALMDDIGRGHACFEGVLVLDVSRWGRFQNVDEAAYYEFLCWRKGVKVFYVSELFENDGSPFSMIFKGLKRAMAAEYSRELSAKTSAGQRHLAGLGYRQGAMPGYGLRRLLVSAHGEARMVLGEGERKSLVTDRIILVPGPPEEVETVRWMFEQYLAGHRCTDIARMLNARGIRTHRGKPWVYATVKNVLDGEKYAGTNVFCRFKKRLAGPLMPNPESDWVRKEGAYEPLVSPETFRAVQTRRRALRVRVTNDELLAQVRKVWAREGRLSGPILDAESTLLSSHGIAYRFGGLTELYRQVGYIPKHNPRYGLIREFLTRWRLSLTGFASEMLEDRGAGVSRDGWRLQVDGAWTLSFTVLHGARAGGARHRQWFNHRRSEDTDIVVFARIIFGDPVPFDYFVLPKALFPTWPRGLYGRNGPLLESCRYPSLAILGDLARLFQREAPWSS
ncbi:recombinase family protein [Luteibacter sp. CQ10]|uniref:recombinase family protein n=1 Tax=Luteibacter sp. CQ10 TaxID=2805821 RepID=UPI0034A51FF1